MAEEAQRPGKTIKLNRLQPNEIIANQLISINTHLASIANDIGYLTKEFRKEKENVG